MSHKLALGTVQFGLQYGVANTSGKVDAKEVSNILQLAKAAGISTLDTAIAYGDSEDCLGQIGVQSWSVITKLPAIPADVDVPTWVQTQVTSALKRLRVEKLDALLLHRSNDIVGKYANEYQEALLNLKLQGFCKSVGVSIYSPDELDLIWGHSSGWHPDIIQAPLNVFDQSLINSGWLNKLNAEGVCVHTRSTFLQGLLVMPSKNRPTFFNPWHPLLNRWLEWCQNQSISPLKAALNFVCNHPGIEKVVIGVDSAKQLKEILVQLSADCPKPPSHLMSDDVDLINPSRWKLV